MIDTNSMGIPMIYQIQRDKCFPLPSYDLDTINRVSVTVYGKILDKNYTQLLHVNGTLDLLTVFMLDRVQKKVPITRDTYSSLRKQGLVEGRYPNIFVSFKVAKAVGEETLYIRNKGLDESVCRSLILKALSLKPSTMIDLLDILDRGALSAILTSKQKARKVSNLLQKMKTEGIIEPIGPRNKAKWYIVETKV